MARYMPKISNPGPGHPPACWCRDRQRSPGLDGVRIGNRAADICDWISPANGQNRDHGRSRHQQPADYDIEGPRSAWVIQRVAIERCPDLAEPFCAQLAPVWELVASIPAPRCDHRQHEDPALAQQALVDTRIVLADFFGRMGEVEFNRPATARLEVYEQQPALRGEHVARVRLAVQQLLGAAAAAGHSSQASQRAAEELPVRVG